VNGIRNFLKDFSGVYPDDPNSDIFKDMAVIGDDFHDMIEDYAKRYNVDMSDYLWYFHADEEGFTSIGGQFFKPPYERVKRIPVTPQMLADFSVTKKWKVDYPPHKIPKQRWDLTINRIIVISFIFGLVISFLWKIWS
jgi:Protein of unknown function (DUF1493)